MTPEELDTIEAAVADDCWNLTTPQMAELVAELRSERDAHLGARQIAHAFAAENTELRTQLAEVKDARDFWEHEALHHSRRSNELSAQRQSALDAIGHEQEIYAPSEADDEADTYDEGFREGNLKALAFAVRALGGNPE